jgi:3-deoxy-manno-octulosonate cytidylyltransferase (CMP-KDO synthetase)
MKIICVIPARYKSSRFPGKPLADIHGKPMVWWVYQQAKQVEQLDAVYLATESDIVEEACRAYDIPVIMTGDSHPTGTDRVAEVAQKIAADLYVVWMGDEPLILAADVSRLIAEFIKDRSSAACMLATAFHNPVDVVNSTAIKLGINDNRDLIFMSRSPIPYPKAALDYKYYKNMGAYAMSKESLDFFLNTKPGNLERAEEIELLRLLENHKKIKTVIVESDSMAVDTQKDLERVKSMITPPPIILYIYRRGAFHASRHTQRRTA